MYEPEFIMESLLEAVRALAQDESAIAQSVEDNPWFSPPLVRHALLALQQMMPLDGAQQVRARYHLPEQTGTLGLILAGNLPLVGFHDMLVGLLCGYELWLKPSSKDRVLVEALVGHLPAVLRRRIQWWEGDRAPDKLIATGSDLSLGHIRARWPETPLLGRGNRFSVAVVPEEVEQSDLNRLAEDILLYHGLGCRSISNVFLPEGFGVCRLAAELNSFGTSKLSPLWEEALALRRAELKFAGEELVPCHAIVLREVTAPTVPAVGSLHVLRYRNPAELAAWREKLGERIQLWMDDLPQWGGSQEPSLFDFADGKDSFLFLGARKIQ